MIVNTFTKRFISCPHCGQGSHEVSHLELGHTFGPWFCDSCNKSFKGKITSNGDVDINIDNYETRRSYSVLVELTAKGRVHLEINHDVYCLNHDKTLEDNIKYYIEEHSCPINVLTFASEIYINEEDDYHGAFKVVSFKEKHKQTFDQEFHSEVIDRVEKGLMNRALR